MSALVELFVAIAAFVIQAIATAVEVVIRLLFPNIGKHGPKAMRFAIGTCITLLSFLIAMGLFWAYTSMQPKSDFDAQEAKRLLKEIVDQAKERAKP
jgi:lysylphosphatidylglycerol synthetase-like protein (DUF2156 family)